MLRFKLHHLQLKGKHYLLLPKLNSQQMGILAERFEDKGFSVHRSSILSAKSRKESFWVNPSGLVWSFSDPEDMVTPAIPELLSCRKQRIAPKALEALYFGASNTNRRQAARLNTRVEAGGLWASLRAAGECGLTPDERSAALALLGGRSCRLVADFAGEEPMRYSQGGKLYFETKLDFDTAQSTLRTAGEKARRNSYLPRSCTLALRGRTSRSKLKDAFTGFGEWCFFVPDDAKALIADPTGPTQPR